MRNTLTTNPTKSSSILSLSAGAVRQNAKFVKKQLHKGTKLSAVVKGNAYGHGIAQMIPLFEAADVAHFSVFSAYEAAQVCAVKHVTSQVMIMGWLSNDDLGWAIENEVSFFVFEQDRLKEALAIAKAKKIKAKIHVELETGMNRTGIEKANIPKVIDTLLSNTAHFILDGLCTHYAGAESMTNDARIQEQIKLFKIYTLEFERAGLQPRSKHSACSAAMIFYPETQMDMVRVGIMLYGFWPSRETFIFHQNQRKESFTKARATDPLCRVIKWSTQIMSVKEVPTGEFIGYGTTYRASKEMTVAAVPVGYAYGFARSLSNQGRAIVNGQRVAVIGTINMNLLMIDISECEGAKKGDEVILIGAAGDVEVTVASFGELSNQLNYELLSRLPQDIPREVVR